MPEAIATTKRKFYRALDALNLSNPSPSRPVEPPVKRARRTASIGSTASASSSVQILSGHAPASIHDEASAPREPPNFSPWSHETFLARLKTFSSVSQWHSKPDCISEVLWARRGWICIDVDTVACRGGCGRRVVVSLTKDPKPAPIPAANAKGLEDVNNDPSEDDGDDHDGSDYELALAKRYEGEIINGHAETCLWRHAGCKDDIYRLPVVRPAVWQAELRARYKSLLALDDAVRDIGIKGLPCQPPTTLPPRRLLDDAPPSILSLTGVLDEREKALEIALHGWRGASESGNDLLHCDACFQRVGLWMYQPGYKPTRSGSEGDDEANAPTLDLVELHRDHCPWRNAESQNAPGSLAGLNASQILQRVISTHAREHRRRTDEQQKLAQPAVDGADEVADNSDNLLPPLSKEEVAKQDRERESKLLKLKRLLTFKRPSSKVTA